MGFPFPRRGEHRGLGANPFPDRQRDAAAVAVADLAL